MHPVRMIALVLGLGGALGAVAAEKKPLPDQAELSRARDWSATGFARAKTGQAPPFSFIYGGKRSADLLPGWTFKESAGKTDGNRVRRTQTYADPATGLEVRVEAALTDGFPTVEWTVYLKNTGSGDSPVLESVAALDIPIRRGPGSGEFVLHHNRGAPNTPRDYEPFATRLGPGIEKRITGAGGRPTNSDLCYFNLEYGGRGVIIALGWPGQIATVFSRDYSDGIRIVSGQESTRFRLKPGEEVRTPLVALQFWSGGSADPALDVMRAQNIWRRWMIAHNLPRPGGRPFPNIISTGATGLFPNYVGTQDVELDVLKTWVKRAPFADCWWIDAGWYPCGDDWWNVGTWEPDLSRYPGGLRAVGGAARASGMKFLVWFEPERVYPGSWLDKNRPQWLLERPGGTSKLLDLGNPEAWNWILDRLDGLIVSEGIDIYRQDFNMDPLEFWRAHDAEDRRGIAENGHVRGLLALWDELERRHPEMLFDECASGGRRNDLEMMRRGVPISKSDLAGGTSSSQCQFYGIASWLPYFGAGTYFGEPYNYRSNIAPWVGTLVDTRDESMDLAPVHRAMAEVRRVMPYLAGDFYPLTPYSLDENVWMAWQFDLPEKGEGLVQAFRRPLNLEESRTFKLHGLDQGAAYEITDFDSPERRIVTGLELMEKGLVLLSRQKPRAMIIVYKRVG